MITYDNKMITKDNKNNGSIYSQFLDAEDKLNSFEEITTYNNFYEFGMGKTDPYKHSDSFNPYPWSIKLEGLIKNPVSPLASSWFA